MKRLAISSVLGMSCALAVFGQPGRSLPPPPESEEFRVSDGLVGPWRQSGCHRVFTQFDKPDCKRIYTDEYLKNDFLVIYDKNGNEWAAFSLTQSKPNHYARLQLPDFKPFSAVFYTIVIFRLVSESTNWFAIVTNEDTETVHYVSKTDPAWAKVGWQYWLEEHARFNIKVAVTPFYRKPGGELDEALNSRDVKEVSYIKADGEWALVSTLEPPFETGWIRWKSGKKVLIGWALNRWQVPDPSPEK